MKAIRCQLPHPTPDELVLPSFEDLLNSQQQFVSHRPETTYLDDANCFRFPPLTEIGNATGPIWIPSQDDELILRLLVIAHATDGTHASVAGTYALLAPLVFWTSMKDDVEQFVSECVHCLRGKSNFFMHYPLGETLTATRPNEILHLDYLYVCPGVKNYKYILVMKCSWTRFTWLIPATACNADTAALALYEWCRAYSQPLWLMTDGGSHFKNDVMTKFTKLYGIQHKITLPRCPWSNGSVENMCGYTMRVIRTLRSANIISQDKFWPNALALIERRINDVPAHPHDYSPRTVFLNHETGRMPTLNSIHPPHTIPAVSIDEIPALVNTAISEFLEQLDFIHAWKIQNQEGHWVRTRTPPAHRRYKSINLDIGDYVLVARPAKDRGKTKWRWIGPMQITALHHRFIYWIQELNTKRKFKAHVRRLMFYCDASRASSADLALIADDAPMTWTLDEILSVEWNKSKRGFTFHVTWEGFEDDIDNTDEPIALIVQDVPQTVREFLATPPSPISPKARTAIEKLLALQPPPTNDEED
eukprot:GHVU01145769.1.p1 GENE.GHVU01145769.1~~GHVU01145769.1.p1  ORF type:complete len:533 (-),score=31.96 GHVU01145769.1:883-2481(-)